ncbi:4-hydroxy-2-oxoglutarate aldolase [Purpureocillium takamizusanense]|uniref:4-hydroxy-2-oxoglutarate aldolase n=1 Tax=Purpureocillium takamizusanense TaxID=2060973 RepID=A0A9Q8VGH6_9HYPO|nr:4-hydroxy-2-oxoglutarate aldolase [Purpureocillium takamizusanense]UNI24561.1 4-hydroxy-2-oxoglutarate aldolase [Purpureocillium takamizusanense]
MAKSLPSGLYAPLPAFFNDADELDIDSYVKHALYVTKPGVIPVVSATIGEAAHLDRQERIELIRALRSALDENNLHETPIVAGVGATSTRETIHFSQDAAAAGADFVLVIAPSYFAAALKANPSAIKTFFTDVASKSPVPVVIYNYPPVAGGIDLTSDDIVDIATTAPNVRGVMLSCGNVGKVSRVTSLLDDSFRTLAGFIDFLLPSVAVGSSGAISPIPNVLPAFAMELWRSTQNLNTPQDWARARRLQEQASSAEAELLTGGVAGVKYLLNQQFGYPSAPRLPLQPLSEDAARRLLQKKHLKQLRET